MMSPKDVMRADRQGEQLVDQLSLADTRAAQNEAYLFTEMDPEYLPGIAL